MKKFYLCQPNKKSQNYKWSGICKEGGRILWKRSLGTTSKKVAEAWKREQEASLYLPESYKPVTKNLFVDVIREEQKFLEKVYGNSKHTLLAYQQYLVKFNKYQLKGDCLQNFNCNDAQKYVNFLLETLSPKSVQETVKFLRRIFERWIMYKYIKENPFAKGMVSHPKVIQKEKAFWSEEEIQMILDNAPDDIFPFWCTLAYTGFRFNEAHSLIFENVDFANSEIIISGKGNKIRVIPMNDLLFQVLFKEMQKFKSGLCFPQIPRTEQGCLKVLKKTLDAFSFRKSGFNNHHRFRHSFASNLIRKGVNAKQVQMLMGHASIRITMDTYGHLFPSDLHNAIKALDTRPTSKIVPFLRHG